VPSSLGHLVVPQYGVIDLDHDELNSELIFQLARDDGVSASGSRGIKRTDGSVSENKSSPSRRKRHKDNNDFA
jgi:hypothetical protein